ncbi:glutathione S-transferase family protein [Piscinibacter sp. HJYY11]|uniref:glutathione S-transferase family protein n=1 Tax=Piscinibacter sp. HJYY11 TaxID=2801333 RepID=UPI00191C9B08|nr:glutathione S-transferase family protein [Piscinibacter sp. HJYY11]MBL0726892.1 glutathione S-transferase family protein [Piscinibacter sp. HJYY11]
MTPILFAGFPQGSSLGLVAASEWLGLPYRVARVHMPDDMLSEAYGRLNGRRETPALILENGQPLTENLAIAHWMASRDTDHRISFAPGSGDSLRMHQLMAFLNTSFTGAFSPLWAAMENPSMPDDVKQVLQHHGREAVALRHTQLEAMIGEGPYLVGERPTLADAIFIGVARWADFHSAVDPRAHPKVQALKARLEADPAVQFAHAVEDGLPATGSGAMVGLVPLAEAIALARPTTGTTSHDIDHSADGRRMAA